MNKELICIICPNSCRIKITYNGRKVKNIIGAQCSKGKEFVINEIRNPMRFFTGSISCKNGDYQLVSVKTNKAVPKEIMEKIAANIKEIEVEAPVEIGQVIWPSITNNHVDLVATRKVKYNKND